MWGFKQIAGLLGTIFKPVGTVVNGWQQRKTAELNNRLAVANAQAQAKIELLKLGKTADIAWENLSIQQSGLKDEYWTLIISIPMVLCFIPATVQYVQDGFAVLQTTPVWYRTLIGIAFGSAFGVRSFGSFMSLMKGAKE